MEMPGSILIPSSLGELSDYLSYMYLTSPTFQSSMNRDGNIDIAFYKLEHGLIKTRKKLGEEKYQKLVEMMQQSRALFDEGKDRDGCFMLQDLAELLRRKK